MCFQCLWIYYWFVNFTCIIDLWTHGFTFFVYLFIVICCLFFWDLQVGKNSPTWRIQIMWTRHDSTNRNGFVSGQICQKHVYLLVRTCKNHGFRAKNCPFDPFVTIHWHKWEYQTLKRWKAWNHEAGTIAACWPTTNARERSFWEEFAKLMVYRPVTYSKHLADLAVDNPSLIDVLPTRKRIFNSNWVRVYFSHGP